MRILVVEDSPTAALHLKRKLEELGHEVIVATNGQKAWEHLQRQHEKLVITDWIMPEMDGLELCRRIRARKDAPYTYVILMTVKDLRKDRLEGLHAGADNFLTKPPDPVELMITMEVASRIISTLASLNERVIRAEKAAGPALHSPPEREPQPEPVPPADDAELSPFADIQWGV